MRKEKLIFAADPIDVMNQVLSSDLEKANNYFRTCVDLFRLSLNMILRVLWNGHLSILSRRPLISVRIELLKGL